MTTNLFPDKEILDILDEQYYSIGCPNGIEAFYNFLDDYIAGRLADYIAEMEIEPDVFRDIYIPSFFNALQSTGKMKTDPMVYYKIK
jgi:hypothetical protein